MAIEISDFPKEPGHPFGILDGYKNAFEKESVLRYILSECVQKTGELGAVRTTHSHPTMVDDGLLVQVGDGNQYKLTPKALGLLYSFYASQPKNTDS